MLLNIKKDIHMELTITEQIDEAEAKRRNRKFFLTFYVNYYVAYALVVVLFSLCGLYLRIEANYLFYALALAYLISILIWFPRNWRIRRAMYRKTGQFEHPTTIHLTDTFMEITCGENYGKNEYGVFSEYIELKDDIAIINQRTCAATFRKKDFPDGGKEFIQCLENAGVKRLSFWSFKRWWRALLAIVLILFLCLLFFLDSQNRSWIHEKSLNTHCVSNLKMLMCDLLIYSAEQQEVGNMTFTQSLNSIEPQSLILQKLADEEYVLEACLTCPKTSIGYIYVPYNRPLDHSSATAANTPVLFDWTIGAHNKCSRMWGKGAPQTHIAFEDGHVSVEENLRCHLDIYERYAPLMSKEDAEILRKCCEEWGHNTVLLDKLDSKEL